MDPNSAFQQIKICPEDQRKTAFVIWYGLYEFARRKFGQCNAPVTFSWAMSLVVRDFTLNIALGFLDDALVLGKDFEDHLANLRSVFVRFREFHLTFKPKKSALFKRRVEFFGRKVRVTNLLGYGSD